MTSLVLRSLVEHAVIFVYLIFWVYSKAGNRKEEKKEKLIRTTEVLLLCYICQIMLTQNFVFWLNICPERLQSIKTCPLYTLIAFSSKNNIQCNFHWIIFDDINRNIVKITERWSVKNAWSWWSKRSEKLKKIYRASTGSNKYSNKLYMNFW